METTKTNETNLAKIRTLLLGGAKITVLSIFRIISTCEGRHYIAILRKEGMKIADEWKTNELTQKRYKIFWLVKE